MTQSELIQGVVVRVAIVGVPLTVMVMMSVFGMDVVTVQGLEFRGFSIFAIPAVLHFFAKYMRVDKPLFLWIAAPLLLGVAISQWDVVGDVPVIGSLSLLSLLGIVSIQYPLAVWLLSFYQKVAADTERSIEIKMEGLGLGEKREP